jgi:hypothetical protein
LIFDHSHDDGYLVSVALANTVSLYWEVLLSRPIIRAQTRTRLTPMTFELKE